MIHAFDSSALEAETGDLSKFKDSLVYNSEFEASKDRGGRETQTQREAERQAGKEVLYNP